MRCFPVTGYDYIFYLALGKCGTLGSLTPLSSAPRGQVPGHQLVGFNKKIRQLIAFDL